MSYLEERFDLDATIELAQAEGILEQFIRLNMEIKHLGLQDVLAATPQCQGQIWMYCREP
mgnify:CR=1 FL=1